MKQHMSKWSSEQKFQSPMHYDSKEAGKDLGNLRQALCFFIPFLSLFILPYFTLVRLSVMSTIKSCIVT